MRSLFAARALISFAAGLYVVFNQGHYVAVCLAALAVFGIGTAVLQLALAIFGKSSLSTIESIPTSIIALAIGAIAALAQVQATQGALGWHIVIQEFAWLVTGWGLTSGAFELYLARRAGFKSTQGRDYAILSALGLLLGLVNLVVPMDRTTTVGMFVAYLMFSAVHLGIASTSPKIESNTAPSKK